MDFWTANAPFILIIVGGGSAMIVAKDVWDWCQKTARFRVSFE